MYLWYDKEPSFNVDDPELPLPKILMDMITQVMNLLTDIMLMNEVGNIIEFKIRLTTSDSTL